MRRNGKGEEKRKNTFFKTSLRSFLAVSIVVTTVLTLTLTVVYTRYIFGLVNQFTGRLIAQSSYSVTYINETSRRLANTLYNDNDVIAFLNMDELDYQYAIRSLQTMDKQVQLAGCVDSIYLYNSSIDCWLSTSDGQLCSSADFFDQEIIGLLQDEAFMQSYDGKPLARTNRGDAQAPNICSYILSRSVPSGSGTQEVLVINVQIATLTESIRTIQSFSGDIPVSFLVTNASWQVVSSYFANESLAAGEEGVNGLLEAVYGSGETGSLTYALNGRDYIVSYQKMPSSEWYVIGLVEQGVFYQDVMQTGLLVLAAALVCVFLFAGVSVVMARRLSSPISALTRRLQQKDSSERIDSDIVELQYIDSILKTMQDQNREYENFRKNASNTVWQSFLSDLVTKSSTLTTEKLEETLDHLGLAFVYQNQLCLSIFRIDDYSLFESENNEKERCALRFCIVNIITELLEKSFTVQAFCCEGDKVAVITDAASFRDYGEFRALWEAALREALQKVNASLKLSLSCAYSSFFSGLAALPVVFENTQELFSLVLKLGHQSVIAPNMAENFDPEDVSRLEEPKAELIGRVLDGNVEEALAAYGAISAQLLNVSCSDIPFFIQNLAYMLYLETQKKWPPAAGQAGSAYRQFILEFEKSDTLEAIHLAAAAYVQKLCGEIRALQSISTTQNSNHVVEAVIAIVQEKYTDKELCTNAIADELNLTVNYVGHLFRTCTGKSISKYLMELRLKQVGDLLRRTNQPLSEILDQCGLEKSNYFYTCFKKYYGVTLSDYRRER